jgi:hypothetical protein
VPGGFFFIFRDFNISEISLIVISIIANLEFVLNYILCVDDIDKCNLLNSFLCSISNLNDNNCNPPNLELRTNSRLAIIEITINEISDILKSLNIKKKPPGTI